MKRIQKKILPVFLAVILLFGLLPSGALALEPDISIESTGSGQDNTPYDGNATPLDGNPGISISPSDTAEPPDATSAPPSPEPDGTAWTDPSEGESRPDIPGPPSGYAEDEPAGLAGAHVFLDSGGAGRRTRDAAQATGTLRITRIEAYNWDFTKGKGAPDMVPWYIMDIDGKIAYCVEPTNPATNPGSYQTLDYNALSGTQQLAIGYVMLYGAQSPDDPLFHMATQVIIWEICLGYLDMTTLTTINKSAYDCAIGYNPGAAPYYAQIITRMRNHMQVPSFTRFVETFAPLHRVSGVDGEYKLDLVNTNPDCDLADYVFTDTGGVSFAKDGQTLHVTAAAPLDSVTYSGVKGSMAELNNLIFWSSGADQIRATGHCDPVTAFFRLTTENIGAYSVTISKLQTGTNIPLAGAEFEVRHSEKGVVGVYTTDGSGQLTAPVPWQGTYICTELTPPANHRVDDNPVKDVVISVGHPNAAVTFHNAPFSGIQITKIDATTQVRIPGVTFRVARQGGSDFTDVVTGPSGIASLPNVEPGVYVLREISCPPAYILDTQARIIEANSGQVAAITIENYAKPSLEITKVDADTGVVLPGATFRVALNGGMEYQDIVSGPDGIARLTGMEAGHYTVEEIVAPEGYLLNGQPQTVEIVAGQVTYITLTNAKMPVLEILKIDSITRQPLPYATFRVSYKVELLLDSVLAVARAARQSHNGMEIGTFTSDANGRVLLDDLEPGLIVIEEIAAPDGYIVSHSPQEILLAGGESKRVVFENTPKSPIIIKKIDSTTGDPLARARFRLTKMNGELIGEFTTGRYGYITVPGLEPGWYTAVEVLAPDGYKLNGAPQNVELKLNGDPGILEFENTALPGLVIRKMDSITGAGLSGVEFLVTALDGREIGTYVTGEGGVIRIPALDEPSVVVRETKPIPGYEMDTAERTVRLVPGEVAEVAFTNTPLPGLLIQKVDSVTGSGLAGVTFEISKLSGERVGTYITDGGGYIFIENITEPYLAVRETAALPGYKIDATEKLVELKPGELNMVTFENSPWPYLVIVKIEEETKAPIPGTEFQLTDASGKEFGVYTTGADGRIVLTGIDAGKYRLRETKAHPAFALDDRAWDIMLEWGCTTTVTFKNKPLNIDVTVEKRGPVEAIAGQEIRYDFRSIANNSSVPLEEFYWHDLLPTDAVRLVSIHTGTWNDENLFYRVVYRTNLKDNWTVLAENLSAKVNHELPSSAQVLGLASNEHVTEYRFEFGTVQPGFREVDAPFIFCRVLADLPNEYQFVNRTDVSGQYGGKWTYDKDSWVTIVYKTPEGKGRLPKTGIYL